MSDFYYRVFTGVDKDIWASEIEARIAETNLGFELAGVVDEEDAENPDARPVELILYDEDENPVASLVYDKLETSDFLADEIAEFTEVADEMAPECNREWVKAKLARTVGCYCFTVHEAGFFNVNWDRMVELASWLREETRGIEQSDGGQISNEEGQIVLIVPDDDGFIDDDDDDVEEDEVVDFNIIDAEDDFNGEDGEDVEEGEDVDDEENFENEEEEEDEADSEDGEYDDEEYGEDDEYGADESEFDDSEEDSEDSSENDDDEDDEDDDDDGDGIEEFEGALRINGEWVVKFVNSEEALEQFIAGEA